VGSYSAYKTFGIDTTIPNTFGLKSPVNLSTVTAMPTLIWHPASDGLSGVRTYELYIGGLLKYSGTDTNWTTDNLADGNYTWYVKAVDMAENARMSDQTWSFTVSQPLAVHLSFFTAGQTETAVELNWRTESETDCATWIIQRSTAIAGTFADIGKTPGQGTSTTPHEYAFTDREQLESGDYLYRIVEISATGNKTYYQPVSVTYKSNTPKVFCLIGAYPNPARGATTIKYQLPEESQVRLEIYNVSGQLVKTVNEGQKPAGYHRIDLNSAQLSNGIYLYRLHAGEFSATKKLVVLK
jgi:hypothetical protein